MAYSCIAVANAVISAAGIAGCLDQLSPIKLQRLLFVVQSLHLWEADVPLLDDHFARWERGPVIPSLYHRLSLYEGRAINAPIGMLHGDSIRFPGIPEQDEVAHGLIRKVVDRFGPLSVAQLVDLTTNDQSAWSRCAEQPSWEAIPTQLMREHAPTLSLAH